MNHQAIERKLRALKDRFDALRKQSLEQMAKFGSVDSDVMRFLFEASTAYDDFKRNPELRQESSDDLAIPHAAAVVVRSVPSLSPAEAFEAAIKSARDNRVGVSEAVEPFRLRFLTAADIPPVDFEVPHADGIEWG